MKPTGRDGIEQPQRWILMVVTLALDGHLIPVRLDSLHRGSARKSCALHPRQRRELVQNRILGPRHHRRILHQRLRNRNPQHLQMRGIRKPRIDAAHARKRPDHQRRAHQQHQRHGHLRHHQHVARPMALAARARRSPPGPGQFLPPPRVLHRRNQPQNESREQRQRKGEGNGPCIQRNLRKPRQIRWTQRGQEPESCERNPHRQRPAHEAQRHALQQQLPRNPQPPCTQRRANRQLHLPRLRSHQQQIRQIGARDHQHQPDGCHHHPQNARYVPDHLLLERLHRRRDLPVLIPVRIGARSIAP